MHKAGHKKLGGNAIIITVLKIAAATKKANSDYGKYN